MTDSSEYLTLLCTIMSQRSSLLVAIFPEDVWKQVEKILHAVKVMEACRDISRWCGDVDACVVTL